ncbi:hypothetical protein [uncultured Maribacter sp.]|uniref:hypothetical protein n=1 Tax=uncultured Maribacter sp. TaxID=431308 RepID=UPI0030EEDD6E
MNGALAVTDSLYPISRFLIKKEDDFQIRNAWLENNSQKRSKTDHESVLNEKFNHKTVHRFHTNPHSNSITDPL